MANLTIDQLRALAVKHGVPQAGTAEINLYGTNDLPYLMAAIAIAESGGNPNAHNTKSPDNSYGLWQINMKGDLGPERRKALGLKRNEDLFNVETNARAMKYILDKQGLKAWTTTHGGPNSAAAKVIKNHGEKVTEHPGETIGESDDGFLGIKGAITGSVNSIVKTLTNLIISGGVLVVALVLLVLGFIVLMRGPVSSLATGRVKKAAKVANKLG